MRKSERFVVQIYTYYIWRFGKRSRAFDRATVKRYVANVTDSVRTLELTVADDEQGYLVKEWFNFHGSFVHYLTVEKSEVSNDLTRHTNSSVQTLELTVANDEQRYLMMLQINVEWPISR
ncbi:hypothetical protein BU15DRAFT_58970 [Melanogaster broomeanus]|nr:hypothetical protein BU15DRAFT_58970 [Melanogaster broomeanus]